MMAHAINGIKRECDGVVVSPSEFLMNHHHHQAHHMMNSSPQSSASAAQVHPQHTQHHPNNATKMGSRRIFTAHFKLQVLDSYRTDGDCKGNQRATARKYGIHRRQIQKWLQCESNLRTSVMNGTAGSSSSANNNHSQSAIDEIHSEINGNATPLSGVEKSLGGVVSSSSSPPSLSAVTSNKFSFSHRNHNNNNNNNLHHHLTSPPSMSAVVASSITGCRFPPAHTNTIDYTPVAPSEQPTTSTSLPVTSATTSTSTSNNNNNIYHHHHQHEVAKCCSPFFTVSSDAAASSAGRSNAISNSDRVLQQQQPRTHHQHHEPTIILNSQAPFHYLVKPAAFSVYWSPPAAPQPHTQRRDGASLRDDYDENDDDENVRTTTTTTAQTEIPTTPIDLSVHNRAITTTNTIKREPAHPKRFWEQTTQPAVVSQSTTNVPRRPQSPDSGAWDLSERKRKMNDVHDVPTPPKVVKLFKPYLMSDDDEAATTSVDETAAPSTDADEPIPTAFKPIPRRQHDPIIWSSYADSQLMMPTTSSPISGLHHHHHHDDTPHRNRAQSRFFPYSSVSPALSVTSSSSPATSPGIVFNHGSPVSGYDTASSSYSTAGSDCGADDRHSLSSRCSSVGTGSTAADGAEYSIDLKMQAIDSYYNDSLCRGSERAVADKFSVHRRDVQQWLMQEDDLRHLMGNQL